MTQRKINDMNEVADSGAVRRVIVVPPNHQLLSFSNCHLRYERQQVVRNADRVFSDATAFVRANRIKVTQDTNPPLIVGTIQIPQQFFDKELCAPVRICRSERMLLVKRQIPGWPVNGCGRTEDERP